MESNSRELGITANKLYLGHSSKNLAQGKPATTSAAEKTTAKNLVALNLTIRVCLGYFMERIAPGGGGGQAERELGEIRGTTSTKGGLDAGT